MEKLRILSWLNGAYFHTGVLSLYYIRYGVELDTIIFSSVLFSITLFLSEIPTGVLTDRFGKVPSLMAAYLLESVGILAMAIWPTATSLFFAYILRGIATGFFSGAFESLAYEVILARDGKGTNYQTEYTKLLSIRSISFALSSLAAGLALLIFGVSAAKALILCSTAAMGGAFLVASSIEHTDSYSEKHLKATEILRGSVQLVRNDRVLMYLVLCGALLLEGKYFFESAYQPYFEQLKISPFFLSAVLGFGVLTHAAIIRAIDFIERSLDLPTVLVLIYGSIATLYLTIATVQNPVVVVISSILLLGLFESDAAIKSDYINERAPSAQRATVISLASLVRHLGKLGLRIGLAYGTGVWSLELIFLLMAAYLTAMTAIVFNRLTACNCIRRLPYEHIKA